MSNADDSDFTPRADESEESSSSDQDTLVEVAEKKRAAGEASKKRSGVPKAEKPAGKGAGARHRTASFGSEELLLVARAFMKVSTDAKHSTDKKAEKFWDEVWQVFNDTTQQPTGVRTSGQVFNDTTQQPTGALTPTRPQRNNQPEFCKLSSITRYIGGMARAPQPQHVRIQPASLVKASKLNKVKLSGMVAWEAVKLCSKHKMFVDLGRRLTPHSLRGRISPLGTVAMLSSMVLCGLILFGCWIGFNKLVVALSLLSLLALIIPIQWKEMLV
ncbi:hypothetical protein HJC23_010906 [Cyclotella cryptica]|uniref:Uncharacterized protein n=1 Tax=Cyclotella cryptica TaxID=29204 RepID=A0ABD3Q9T5_9STRA